MNRYLRTMIVNARSMIKTNNVEAFRLIRDTFQDEGLSQYRLFRTASIKNNTDLIVAYHEKKILDACNDYIETIKELFKDSEIKRPNAKIDGIDDL